MMQTTRLISSLRLRGSRPQRRGQALVEFAMIALVMYLLLAAIFTFGHLLYVAQGLQSAADLTARELSRMPLPATINESETSVERPLLFEDVVRTPTQSDGSTIYNERFRARIFDEAYLVIDLDVFYDQNPGGNLFADLVPEMPLLNQQLVPLMIVDRPDLGGEQRARLLRYPGALLRRSTPIVPPPPGPEKEPIAYDPSVAVDYTVGIPLVVRGNDSEGESIRWVEIIEEIGNQPFSIDSVERGVVALRINYPFQSASMSSFRPNPAGPFEPTIATPVVADDDGFVAELNEAPGELLALPLVSPGGDSGPIYTGTYGGRYGLGSQGALGQMVRPYRRVLSAHAIYRREIFSDEIFSD